MPIRICTIGFTGKTAEEFFALLKTAGVKQVIDVRENRIGQLAGFAKYPDIEFFLRQICGITYAHEPQLAPSREIRQRYMKTRDWNEYEPAFLALMRERKIPESLDLAQFRETTALLCSEPGPEKCHRRLVADLVAERLRAAGEAVEIRHLVAERKAKGTRSRAAGKSRRSRKNAAEDAAA